MRTMDLTGIEAAQKPVFFCSFGKDSAAVLHALQPWLHKTMVVFIDCGGVFPDIVDWAHKEGAKLPKFFYLHPTGDIWQDIHTKGWATDIELADIGRHSDLLAPTEMAYRHKTRPWTQCVMERFWIPGFVFTQMYKPDLYISGEKRLDRPFANDWETRTHGVAKALRPVFDWSDSEVWEYIDANGIELAPTFRDRQADRRDCYLCFGHGLTINRVQYLKDKYPDLYKKVFFEEGLSELVPIMVDQLRKTLGTWEQIQGLLEE